MIIEKEQENRTTQPTVANIAMLAGVSTATVSRSLNGHDGVSSEIKKKVVRIAEEVGYKPDLRYRWMAQNRGRSSVRQGNIGILMSDSFGNMLMTPEGEIAAATFFMTSPYYARMFWSIEREVSSLKRHLVVATLNSVENQYLPDFVKDLKVDGVLFVGNKNRSLVERIADIMPVVTLNTNMAIPHVPSLMPDEASGINQAMDYLRDLGHKHICFFDIHAEREVNSRSHHVLRERAFCNYIEQYSLTDSYTAISTGDKSSVDTIRELFHEFKNSSRMPTAVICGADTHAISFLRVAEEFGVSIPDEISLIGADNIVLCEYMRPKLTSINQPFEEIGVAGVRTLIDMLDGIKTTMSAMLFDVSLVKRNSCSVPRDI